ncbi:MAG: hypothetical protein HWN68_20730, partial [Desulfobacterales bacterium]|nr:hypothetical protein [Desulfobacterales bacterium]
FKKIFNSLKRRYWSRQVRKGIRVLENLDGMMGKAHWPRHKRRQFWREFVKRQANREKVYGELRRVSKR